MTYDLVVVGCGAAPGQELRRWSAARLAPGESAEVLATNELQMTEMAVRSIGDLQVQRRSDAPSNNAIVTESR
ncbi:MAG TPA: hypothetical protein VG994_04915 [Steroidobacteraceae bacterium]|nr:hypothetical protein [Steroidobacteraceae bacterium]